MMVIASKVIISRKGLGPISLAVAVSVVTLLTSFAALSLSQINQIRTARQLSLQAVEGLNNDAVILTRKLILSKEIIKNTSSQIWSAATSHSKNSLWESVTPTKNTFGILSIARCDPRTTKISSIENGSNALASCSKLTTQVSFLAESKGRPQVEVLTQLSKQTRKSLRVAIMPPPSADLKVAGPSGVASNGTLLINKGENVTLSWTSSYADRCNLAPLANTKLNQSGLNSGPLNSSVTFVLKCDGVVGSVTDSVTVNVALPPIAEVPALTCAFKMRWYEDSNDAFDYRGIVADDGKTSEGKFVRWDYASKKQNSMEMMVGSQLGLVIQNQFVRVGQPLVSGLDFSKPLLGKVRVVFPMRYKGVSYGKFTWESAVHDIRQYFNKDDAGMTGGQSPTHSPLATNLSWQRCNRKYESNRVNQVTHAFMWTYNGIWTPPY